MISRRYILRAESSDGTFAEVVASKSDLVEIARLLAALDEPAVWPPPTGDMHESRLHNAGAITEFGPTLADGKGGESEFWDACWHWDEQGVPR